MMSLQVTPWRADVHPVGALWDMSVELFAAFEQVGKEPVLEGMVFARRNQVEHLRLKYVSPCVDRVDGNLIGLGLFQKTTYATVLLGLHQSVGRRILNRGEHDRGNRLSLVVFAYDRFEVKVCQHVAVEDDRSLAYQVFGELVCP